MFMVVLVSINGFDKLRVNNTHSGKTAAIDAILECKALKNLHQLSLMRTVGAAKVE